MAEAHPAIDPATLRELLDDPECPYGRDGDDVVAALREGRAPTQTRYLSLRELAPFVEQRLGREVDWHELDRIMVSEIGAEHVPVVDLQGIVRRMLGRLVGRRTAAPPTYEVPR
jgi:hypothetical protein